jgi:aspartyl-tRNA(Asn)/glutamyl-tRNA(Gln) amidotransferase subunit A
VHARHQLNQIRDSVSRAFDTADLVITPTSPVPPFDISDLIDVNTARAKELQTLHNTRPINAFGLPTISVPYCFSTHGLPIGMQISGLPWSEVTVFPPRPRVRAGDRMT